MSGGHSHDRPPIDVPEETTEPTAGAGSAGVAAPLPEIEDYPSTVADEMEASVGGGGLRFLTGLQSFRSQEWQADSMPELEEGGEVLEMPLRDLEAQ